MDIKELRLSTGMTQTEFGEYLNIPMRTIQNWEGRQRNCPKYVIELIEYKLEKEDIMTTNELKQFLDAELEKAEISHQETLKKHKEIMDACDRMKKLCRKS